MLLLKRLEMPMSRAVLYAWNPLAVLEIAGSGHVDGAGLTMLMGALCLVVIGRKSDSAPAASRWPILLSGALLACAGLVKLFPFMVTPLLLLLIPTGRRRYFVTGFIAALALLVVPFLPHITNMSTSLNAYARNWEFASFSFNTLRTVTGSGITARVLLSVCFLLVTGGITLRLAGRIKNDISPIENGRKVLGAVMPSPWRYCCLPRPCNPGMPSASRCFYRSAPVRPVCCSVGRCS